MTRYLLILVIGLFFLACPAFAEQRPPNIIVVLIDDLGWMDLSCQGNGYFKTPNIDAFASRGVRFTQGYAACAVCSPTRAAVLTGQYPQRIGITDWIRGNYVKKMRPAELTQMPGYSGDPKQRLACPLNVYDMPHSVVTLAERLKPAGYATCYIGKWHLGDEGYLPTDQGFDQNFGGYGYGSPPSYFDPYTNKRNPEGIPTLQPRKEGEYLTDREADEAVRFIRDHKDKPFYLHLAHHAVHTPIQAKADVAARYEQAGKTKQNAMYAAMVQSVDEAMGRVMSTLDELKIADRTLVIFTSDNGGLDRDGDPTDNAPLRSGKGYPYEGGIRVPFIVHWPGVTKPGTTRDTPVISMDVFASVMDAAGIKAPNDIPLDGISLRSILKSNTRPQRPLVWHFPHYRYEDVGPYSVIRDGDFKLIHYYDTEKSELYNLADDPYEQNNLAESDTQRVALLTAQLQAMLKETNSKMPRPNPVYKSD